MRIAFTSGHDPLAGDTALSDLAHSVIATPPMTMAAIKAPIPIRAGFLILGPPVRGLPTSDSLYCNRCAPREASSLRFLIGTLAFETRYRV
jgi:hypothetical protein